MPQGERRESDGGEGEGGEREQLGVVPVAVVVERHVVGARGDVDGDERGGRSSGLAGVGR